MKNVTVFLFLISQLLLLKNELMAQTSNIGLISCGAPDEEFQPVSAAAKNHCFTVNAVQLNCTKLYVRMNVHFFLQTDCSGSIDPSNSPDIEIEDAYHIAEDWVNRANVELEENEEQWNQIPMWGLNVVKPAQCVPWRFVLSGVYIHCNTTADNTVITNVASLAYFQNNFAVNPTTEYNAYIVDFPGLSGGAVVGLGVNYFTSEGFSAATLNHEMGHAFGLDHSWDIDGITDTPPIHFMYDYNCDGDLNDNFSFPGVGQETRQRQCFFYFTDDPNVSIDYDGDGVVDYLDYCDIPDPSCADYPCCDWYFINNNTMAYSSYTECCGAFTEDQITVVLDHLSTLDGCQFIEEITDDICLPPMSNIHVLPNESVDEDCAYCFQIGASMHDEFYKIDFYNPSGSLHYSTDWKTGPAWQYCISRSIKYPTEYKRGFLPNVEYTAVLTVENDCGDEASESITFTLSTLPSDGCSQVIETTPKVKIDGLFPNPIINTANLDYSTERGGNLGIWLIPHSDNTPDILIGTDYVPSEGDYSKTLDLSGQVPGLYYLVLELDGELISQSLLKL